MGTNPTHPFWHNSCEWERIPYAPLGNNSFFWERIPITPLGTNRCELERIPNTPLESILIFFAKVARSFSNLDKIDGKSIQDRRTRGWFPIFDLRLCEQEIRPLLLKAKSWAGYPWTQLVRPTQSGTRLWQCLTRATAVNGNESQTPLWAQFSVRIFKPAM